MGNFIDVKKHFEHEQQLEMEKNKIINKETIIDKQKSQPEENQRAFGYFRCKKCKKEWTSAYSWPNKWQKCNKCKINIHPYNQVRLQKSTQIKSVKPHNTAHCQKCIELGRGCDT
jgi:hypothetical protein